MYRLMVKLDGGFVLIGADYIIESNEWKKLEII